MIFYYRIAGKPDCADCSHQNCSAEGSLQRKIPENVSFRARNEVGGPIDLVKFKENRGDYFKFSLMIILRSLSLGLRFIFSEGSSFVWNA